MPKTPQSNLPRPGIPLHREMLKSPVRHIRQRNVVCDNPTIFNDRNPFMRNELFMSISRLFLLYPRGYIRRSSVRPHQGGGIMATPRSIIVVHASLSGAKRSHRFPVVVHITIRVCLLVKRLQETPGPYQFPANSQHAISLALLFCLASGLCISTACDGVPETCTVPVADSKSQHRC